MSDPFQRRWYLPQILIHNTAEDVRLLGKDKVVRVFDHLRLSVDIETIWRSFLESRHD